MAAAPLIANRALKSGIAGGEYGTRGFIGGWNPDTNAKLWRFHTTATGTDKGADTWPGNTAMKGGAPTWLTGVADPGLDLVYWAHRQQPPMKCRSPQRRQPLRRLGAGAHAQTRRTAVAPTVFAQRSVRLRRRRNGYVG